MIKFNPDSLELSPAVAKALMAFASKDKTRSHLCGLGINNGDPCATDGHTAVRFVTPVRVAGHFDYNDRVFSRKYVETQTKVALAKGENVCLLWSALDTCHPFPPLHQVEPKGFKLESSEPVAFDSDYTARLQLVAKACARPKDESNKRSKIPPVRLTHVSGPMDPIGFTIGETPASDADRFEHEARATIMPIRV